jgi:formylglycine-generating enzyme required for sulfatase activity
LALGIGCSAVRGPGFSDLGGSDETSQDDEAHGGAPRTANGPGASTGSGGGEQTAIAKRLDVKCTQPPPAPPSVQITVPAGDFAMGCDPKLDAMYRPDEGPVHAVSLSTFTIDQTEVTQAQYYECVAAGVCLAPTCDWSPCGPRANFPVVCVNRDDAETYCAWRKQRLPTEAEWEKAARGTDGLTYPWGVDPPDCDHANMAGCGDGTRAVGTLPMGASVYGALDMAGNVVEWVHDVYDPNYYATAPKDDPTGPTKGESYVGRGGGFRSTTEWQRGGARDDYEAGYFKNSLGLRCAR